MTLLMINIPIFKDSILYFVIFHSSRKSGTGCLSRDSPVESF